MMFNWKPDMIRYMIDASERSDYHERLALKIATHLGFGGSICDCGCGLGYLSKAMHPYFDHITSVELAPQALQVLQTCVSRGYFPKITPVCGDVHTLQPEQPYDKMVFCLYGSVPDIFDIARRQCRGKIIIIKKNWSSHRFSVGSQPMRNYTLGKTCDLLDAYNMPYTAEACSIELGQPFRSLEDAVQFFRIYSCDPNPASITAGEVLPKLQRQDSEEFPYYLPEAKKLGILVVDVRDIPEDFSFDDYERYDQPMEAAK